MAVYRITTYIIADVMYDITVDVIAHQSCCTSAKRSAICPRIAPITSIPLDHSHKLIGKGGNAASVLYFGTLHVNRLPEVHDNSNLLSIL
jgi:hypothetical protein